MDIADEAVFELGLGIRGNADRGGKRQITIITREAWGRVCQHLGADIPPEARRANLLLSGISLTESRGKILTIGSCRLKIEGETRPCYRMDEAYPGLQDALKYDWAGGVYCTIVDGGNVQSGDIVSISSEALKPESKL